MVLLKPQEWAENKNAVWRYLYHEFLMDLVTPKATGPYLWSANGSFERLIKVQNICLYY
jgi:hypothetical protein